MVACVFEMQSASVAQYLPTPSEFPAVPAATQPLPESVLLPLSAFVPPSAPGGPASSVVTVPPPGLLELEHASGAETSAAVTKARATICFCMTTP